MLATTPIGAPFDARERGDDAFAESGSELEHRPGVAQRVDHRAHVVGAHAVLGHDVSQRALVDALPLGDLVAEEGEVLLRDSYRFGLVFDQDVDDTVRDLHGDGSDRGRLVRAEPAALDHRRATHADVRTFGRDDHVAASEERGVAGEAVAGGDADERHERTEPREVVEREAVEPGDGRTVGVARPAPAAFGEEDDGEAHAFRELEEPVLLLVVPHALRSCEHGVVVRHRDHRVTVDRADAADEPIGRSAFDELLQRAPPALARDDERRVLDEAAFVDEIGDVLARGALARVVPAGDGVGPAVVEPDVVPLDDFGEIRADAVEVDRGVRPGGRRVAGVAARRWSPARHPASRSRPRRSPGSRRRRRTRPRRRAPSSSTRARRAAARRALRRPRGRRSTRRSPAWGRARAASCLSSPAILHRWCKPAPTGQTAGTT